jgi:magnesium chelatase family protein
VLFLDELPEFPRAALEALREPLESGHIRISRAAVQSEFPARFQLVAAMNPCPCGFLGHPSQPCRDTPDQVARYQGRLSGPLLDRIDLHLEVPAVPFNELSGTREGTGSKEMRAQVDSAREKQAKRFGRSGTLLNSRMTPKQIRAFCTLDADGVSLMQTAMDELGLSARAHDRILRMSRTIADLDGSDAIKPDHVAEAIGYRSLDRRLWAKKS